MFDDQFRVTTFNQGAQSILGVDMRLVTGRPMETVEGMIDFANTIRRAFSQHAAMGSERLHWQEQFEVVLPRPETTQGTQSLTLLARGTRLSGDERGSGYVVVFDDISEVISANRSVAWAEVARRLAHEIKNPLTPIQLSAERLAMKLIDKLDEKDAALLERSTNTIVNQVASLKHMVDEFREYARKPPRVYGPVNLNSLIEDVLTLYGWDPHDVGRRDRAHAIRFDVRLSPDLPKVRGELTQLRQVIHNLLGNAREALAEAQSEGMIQVTTEITQAGLGDDASEPAVLLTVADNGPGFSSQLLQRAFEPYVTTKAQGTGLGLAIVKKIVDEHGGYIELSNRRAGGARVTIMLVPYVSGATSVADPTQANDNHSIR